MSRIDNQRVAKLLIGEKIVSIEVIDSEFGRTYTYYWCIILENGEKVIIGGCVPCNPTPDPEEMKKAPNYFSPEDIANRVMKIEKDKRNRLLEKSQTEKREYERLKKIYED